MHKEEYETWQLVNELIFGENMYWERKKLNPINKKDYCPKTLEIETLKTNHNALTIHAVAHWLEKTYDVNEEAKIMQTNLKVAENQIDFEDKRPAQQSGSLRSDFDNLKALFEYMRAGKMVEA